MPCLPRASLTYSTILFVSLCIRSTCLNQTYHVNMVIYTCHCHQLILYRVFLLLFQGSDGGGSVVFSSGEFGARGVAGALVGPGGAPPAGGGPVGGGASPAPAPLPQPAPSPAPAALPPPPYTTSNMQVRSSQPTITALCFGWNILCWKTTIQTWNVACNGLNRVWWPCLNIIGLRNLSLPHLLTSSLPSASGDRIMKSNWGS